MTVRMLGTRRMRAPLKAVSSNGVAWDSISPEWTSWLRGGVQGTHRTPDSDRKPNPPLRLSHTLSIFRLLEVLKAGHRRWDIDTDPLRLGKRQDVVLSANVSTGDALRGERGNGIVDGDRMKCA